MKTQTKLFLGVAGLFLLMALAWAALFIAASKANVEYIPVGGALRPDERRPSALNHTLLKPTASHVRGIKPLLQF